jgi:hypothetical protein
MSQSAAGRPPVAPSSPAAAKDVPKITVSQNALFFPTPIESNVENSVDFTNTEDALVLFKVKTSDVNRYVVRPKVGIIQPRSSATIRFVLLSEHLPSVDAAKNDRFSVHVRFAKKGEKLNDPAACWAADKSADARLNFSCKFMTKSELPTGMHCTLEQPTPTKGATGSRRARSHTPHNADQTPRSIQASPANSAAAAVAAGGEAANAAINAAQSQVASKIGDPSASSLASARKAKADAQQAGSQYAAATAAKASAGAVQLSGQLPQVKSAAGQPSTPAVASPTTTTTTVSRKGAGSRKSAFKQAFTPSVPTIIVIPLMLACFAAGIYSEHWMAHVEAWLQYVQFVVRVLSTPTMQPPTA